LRKHLQNNALNLILKDWNRLPISNKPWGVWICLYAFIPELKPKQFSTCPLEAWFLNDKGLHKHSIHEFVRFFVVHFIQPWCLKGSSKEPSAILKKPYDIWIVQFAQCASPNIYERILLSSWADTKILKADANGDLKIEKVLEYH
jgi:hypothetical protein